MKTFRVLIADDEHLARSVLRSLLEQDPEVQLVAECGDGLSALEGLRTHRPDAAFLDMEMPELGGLEVAAALSPEEMPALVFVTAFGHYAAKAFEVEALDYVVKPFSDQRFFTALERAKRRVREQRLGDLAQKIASLTSHLEPESPPPREDRYLTRVPVRQRDRQILIPTHEILWIESDDYLARLHTSTGSRLVRFSLSWFEEKLDPRIFVRTHRKSIVNLTAVTAIEPLFKGACSLILKDGTRVSVSRSRRRCVEERLLPRPIGTANK